MKVSTLGWLEALYRSQHNPTQPCQVDAEYRFVCYYRYLHANDGLLTKPSLEAFHLADERSDLAHEV